MRTITTAGDVYAPTGMASHLYFVTAPMADEAFFNADGAMMLVPQEGALRLLTELGTIEEAGGRVNLEVDRMARYAARLIASR